MKFECRHCGYTDNDKHRFAQHVESIAHKEAVLGDIS